ncbi:endonuclease [Patescibacteria group bacterium]|nr:endonuclease [Patescibacteria group bacterium]MBU4274424.1 endonuclease [Patescibacteria group bacterium]MBU4368060.1 endonuclease [Patescibacteria group bacterium]MBU4462231.1 endonuclease [Patescibacteria group bacterium]MCG2699587.1 endonuclease [Candidatus Parcubacteria bacterium]
MNVFERLYKELRKKYGTPKGQWKLWCKRPKTKREREKVIIGAILTQRTNWKNVELALNNLKKAKINSLRDIYRLGAKKLAPLIKPSGFYKTKAQYLLNLTKFVITEGWLDNTRHTIKKAELEKLREELLELKGIGPETADSILLYVLDKPIFVIDEYTRRLVKNHNLASRTDYQFLQKLFEENLRKDYRLYQDFHALIVINAKNSIN